jgi:hypothetical protein
MADENGDKIINALALDTLIKQGEERRKTCEAATEKRYKEDEEAKKAEVMKKLSEIRALPARLLVVRVSKILPN